MPTIIQLEEEQSRNAKSVLLKFPDFYLRVGRRQGDRPLILRFTDQMSEIWELSLVSLLGGRVPTT